MRLDFHFYFFHIKFMKMYNILSIRNFAVIVFCLISLPSQGNTQGVVTPGHETLPQVISSILDDSIYRPAFIGLKVVSIDDGTILYERNSNKLFHPASNLKLLTTATAIHLLPSGFLFSTSLSTDGKISDNVLHGNLYVHGHGDPLLNTADLDTLAQRLLQKGIKSITGRLIGNINYFDTLAWGRGWMWDDEPQADEPFLTPLSVNGNAVLLHITAGSKEHDSLSFSLEPQTSIVSVKNNGITTEDTSIEKVHANRPHQTNTITIEGGIPPGETYDLGVSVPNPAHSFLRLFKERLEFAGIQIKGSPTIGYSGGKNIITSFSHPLDSVIFRANRMSDNLAAELLLKTLAAENNTVPGTASDGIKLVMRYLHSVGIDTSMIMIADGSGVSWYNAATPNAMVRLLRYEALRQKTFSRFYSSLAIAGKEGTLRNRMTGARATDNVHAKTGTLTGVSCISGYVTSADNKLCAFSIFCNHFPGELRYIREMQDSILEFIARNPIGRK
jgi:serine-type D-Ala-D-Ala carboxypeptidase/endopeptidase (penicillin-binding protein 4)